MDEKQNRPPGSTNCVSDSNSISDNAAEQVQQNQGEMI